LLELPQQFAFGLRLKFFVILSWSLSLFSVEIAVARFGSFMTSSVSCLPILLSQRL
jgi:hypothetical protein